MTTTTHETHTITVAVDIDGVLADYSQGWQGAECIGAPLPGARQFLEDLKYAGYYVILHTTRDAATVAVWAAEHDILHGTHFDAINDNPNLRGANAGCRGTVPWEGFSFLPLGVVCWSETVLYC